MAFVFHAQAKRPRGGRIHQKGRATLQPQKARGRFADCVFPVEACGGDVVDLLFPALVVFPEITRKSRTRIPSRKVLPQFPEQIVREGSAEALM